MGQTLKNNMPKLVKYLNDKNSIFIDDILDLAGEIEDRLNRISIVFDKYTLHNIEHCMRVMDYMYDLIDDVTKLNDFEITLMVLSALLHDIGMCIEEKEIEEIIKDNGNERINFQALLKLMNGNKKVANQEYVRREHGNRSYEIICRDYKEKFIIPETTRINYSEDLGICCKSHNMDLNSLNEEFKKTKVKGKYEYNLMYISILLRLGDILDIDERRTPYYLYKLIEPIGFSDLEWKQHYIIHNDKKIISLTNGEKKIVLTGECDEPTIYHKILQYLEWIDYEVLECTKVGCHLDEKYKVNLKYPIERNIGTKGFSSLNLEIKTDYLAISNLLMGENIYGSSNIGLREVIQNSIDACKVRKEKYDESKKNWADEFVSTIKIIINKSTNEVIIKDNGTGMDLNIISNYFLNIGKSYYSSDEFRLQGCNYNPIGRFGIGFLSCFMLGDSVEVVTKHFKEGVQRKIFLNKNSKYSYFKKESDNDFEGTEVIFKYNEFMSHFDNNIDSVKNFIIKYFDAPLIKFEFYENENREVLKYIDKKVKSDYSIELSKYMNQICGNIDFNIKLDTLNLDFNEFAKENGIIFYYDGRELNIIDDDINFDDFISDDQIYIVDVESVGEEDKNKFDEYLNILDDFDDVFGKLKLPLLGILVPKKLAKDDFQDFSDEILMKDEIVIGDLKVNDLCSIGQEKDYPVNISYRIERVFFNKLGDRIIKYEPKNEINHYNRQENGCIYLRNVLLDYETTKFENIINKVKVINAKINIENSKLLPDLSRSYLDRKSREELKYAISKVIYLYLIDELEASDALILKEFLNSKFDKKSYLIKNEIV